MSKKRSGLVEKKCNGCTKISRVRPEVDKCCTCGREDALEVVEAIDVVPESLRPKMKTRRRDHRKGRRVGSCGVRV